MVKLQNIFFRSTETQNKTSSMKFVLENYIYLPFNPLLAQQKDQSYPQLYQMKSKFNNYLTHAIYHQNYDVSLKYPFMYNCQFFLYISGRNLLLIIKLIFCSTANQNLSSLMSILTQMQLFAWQNMSTVLTIVVLGILYGLYLYFFKYHAVIMKGDYDTKLKNIGRTIPPYPNGWYIVCKSKQIAPGQSKAIDQSGHNVTVFRSRNGKLFALHSYCAHLGANLGIGGKVVNQKCIQCPFHGWLYDGQTGICVDYDNKPVKMLNVQYNDDMGSQGCKKVEWKEGKQEHAKLRKYHVKQQHGFIYLWLHVDQNQQPQFQFLNVEGYQSKLQNRGYTKHTIRCHVQDIPQNGADAYHFKYVHKLPITGLNSIQFMWVPDWKTGDNPDLPALFQHKVKHIHQFKQGIYNNLVKDHKNKQYLSFANIDNYILLPILGKFFVFNLTVVQMGPGLVYVFLKTHFFTVLFVQYVQTKQKYQQVLYHQMYASSYLPYWLTAVMLRGEAIQVSNDMYVWDAKKFGHRIFYKPNSEADQFILKWRSWFSKYYQGCSRLDGENKKVDW